MAPCGAQVYSQHRVQLKHVRDAPAASHMPARAHSERPGGLRDAFGVSRTLPEAPSLEAAVHKFRIVVEARRNQPRIVSYLRLHLGF